MSAPRILHGLLAALAAMVPPAWTLAQDRPDGGARGAVLEHHGGPRRDGVYVDPTLTRAAARAFHLDPRFKAVVAGAIYAQPLYVPGPRGTDLVIAATERNNVSAFDARSGAA